MPKYKAVLLQFDDENGYVKWSDDYLHTNPMHKLDILKDWYTELEREYKEVFQIEYGTDATDNKYLWKRHNVYWVRVRVPNSVRHIIGKSELSKNLYTKDLLEANRLKLREVNKFKEEIYLAQKEHERKCKSKSRTTS